jgi:hypothetical protein
MARTEDYPRHIEEIIEHLILACSPKLRTILQTARQQIREGKGIPHDEFWQEMEKDEQPKP